MKKRFKLVSLSLAILFTSLLFADADKKPVDEGQRNIHKEDRIKGTTTVKNVFQKKSISLSKLKESYKIEGKELNHAPFKFYHYEEKRKKMILVSTEKENNIAFEIAKTLLSKGDALYVTNDLKTKNGLYEKFVIIEINIIK